MTKKQRWLMLAGAATGWVLLFFPWLPNRSFEHYPLSGPLISFLYHSPVWPDRLIGIPISALWLLGIFYPIVRLNVFTVVFSALSLVTWFALSIVAAASASC